MADQVSRVIVVDDDQDVALYTQTVLQKRAQHGPQAVLVFAVAGVLVVIRQVFLV